MKVITLTGRFNDQIKHRDLFSFLSTVNTYVRHTHERTYPQKHLDVVVSTGVGVGKTLIETHFRVQSHLSPNLFFSRGGEYRMGPLANIRLIFEWRDKKKETKVKMILYDVCMFSSLYYTYYTYLYMYKYMCKSKHTYT